MEFRAGGEDAWSPSDSGGEPFIVATGGRGCGLAAGIGDELRAQPASANAASSIAAMDARRREAGREEPRR